MPVITTSKPTRKKPIKGKAVRPSKKIEMTAREWLLRLAKSMKEDVDRISPLFDDPQSAYSALGSLLQKYDNILDAETFSTQWAEMASAAEKVKLEMQLADALGVDMAHILDDEATRNAVLNAQHEAQSLMRSFPRGYLADVSKAVLDGFQQQLPDGVSLTDRIEEITGHTRKRARLIARDQTSKMTSALNQHRQQNVGIEEYIWRTAGDGRVVGFPGGYKPNSVHGNHFSRNHKVFRWDDPPEDGHAGFPIGCRCVSIPVIDPEKINFA